MDFSVVAIGVLLVKVLGKIFFFFTKEVVCTRFVFVTLFNASYFKSADRVSD